MSALNAAQSLQEITRSLEGYTRYNNNIPAYAQKKADAGGTKLKPGHILYLNNTVGTPDDADKKIQEVLSANKIDLEACRNDPALAPLVAAVETSAATYRDSIATARAGIEAVAAAVANRTRGCR